VTVGRWRRGGVAAIVAIALASGVPSARAKLPDRRTTSLGNTITLRAYLAAGRSRPTASVQVEVCTGAHSTPGTAAESALFVLRLASGRAVRALRTAVRKPSLAVTPLQPNECVIGWISFAVERRARVRALEYTYGRALVWRLR
jgi:hypothetical protein